MVESTVSRRFATSCRSLAAALLAGGLLVPTLATAHVGETVAHRWGLRLHMATQYGRPDSVAMSAWKVPVASYKGAYDDSASNPLATMLPTPNAAEFRPLRLTTPPEYYPVCVQGAYAGQYSNDTEGFYAGGQGGYVCDPSGSFRMLAGENAVNRLDWWAGMALRNQNCVAATVTPSAGCESMYSEYGGSPGSCSVSINVNGVGSWTVAATPSGGVYNLPDFWHMNKVPHWDGAYLCPEGSQTRSCGTAGVIPGCAYYGVQDAWDKARRVLPMTQPQIAAGTAYDHATLATQAYTWFEANLKAEQVGAGYFTYLQSNLLLKTGGSGTNVSEWTSVPAEAHWAIYIDNTPGEKVEMPGYNTMGSYGQTLVRRLGMEGVGRYMYCRYNSGTLEYLPPTWGFEGSGYLSCAVWEVNAALPSPTMISSNIFQDASVPNSELGLDLDNAYDDVEYASDAACTESEAGCPGPLDPAGPGTALIQEKVLPAMRDYAVDVAIVDYISGQRVALAELEGAPGEELLRTIVRPSGTPENPVGALAQETDYLSYADDTPVENLDWVGDYGLNAMKYGMSWNILERNVSFPMCDDPAPITMSQGWRWSAANSLPLLKWDAYRAVVDAQGAQMTGETKSDSGATGLEDLKAQGRYADWTTSRGSVPIPLAAALWVPFDWLDTAKFLYTEQEYEADAPEPLPSYGKWKNQFYPNFQFPPEMDRFGQQSVRAPYFVLNPYNYPSNHRGYYEILDARDSDIMRDPLFVGRTLSTLNHAYVSAPYENGTVSGDIYQSRKVFECKKSEPRTVCVREETTSVCDIVDGEEVCRDVTTCVETMTYEACVESACRQDYCGWQMVSSAPGAWLVEESEADCRNIPAVKEYLDKGWLPPKSADGEILKSGSSALADYVAAQERAAVNEEEERQRARGEGGGLGTPRF